MDGPRHDLLSRAALSANQHRGVRRGHQVDLLHHLPQSGAVSDDLAEVVLALKFFGQVLVRGPRARVRALLKDPRGDVDHHRARVGAVGRRFRPPLHPDGFTVVLAAEFQHDAAGVFAFGDGAKRLASPWIRRLRHQRPSQRLRHGSRLDAKQLDRGAVGADEARVEVLVDVCDRRLVEEILEGFSSLGRFRCPGRPSQSVAVRTASDFGSVNRQCLACEHRSVPSPTRCECGSKAKLAE